MNLKKILLSSVAAVALTSVAAFAAGGNTDPIDIANDGTGDYLIYPAYFANTSGWSTNIKVVNSNTTHAIVAKVIIRESVLSNEKLDFPIYLSPGDVWEATLSNSGGNVIMTSTDDSMYSSGTGATSKFGDTEPVTKALAAQGTGENNTMGYVEVFGVAAVAANDNNISGTSWNGAPVPKYKIRDTYLTYLNVGAAGVGPWIAVDNDSLYGQEVISAANSSGNLAMTLPATALINVTGPTANDFLIIAQASDLANSTTRTGALNAMILGLQKSNAFVTYYENAAGSALADTVVLMTQPMKKYLGVSNLPAFGYDHVAISTTTRAGTNDTSGAVEADLTKGTALNNYAFSYVATPRDQSENRPTVSSDQFSGFDSNSTIYRCNTELCYLNVGASGMTPVGYIKGWVDINVMQDVNTSLSVELPVIPTVMTAKSVGGTNVTNIIYPAYK